MSTGGWLLSAIISVVLGFAVNECGELSPAIACWLVRWSARRRYRDAARAEERAEELAAYVNDRPGKLFKLIVALGFAVRALGKTGERSPAPVIAVSSGLVKPLVVDLGFASYSDQDASVWPERAQRMERAWRRLGDDVDAAMAAHGKHYRGGERRRLERLAKATGNADWTAVADNVARLETALSQLEAMTDDGGLNISSSVVSRPLGLRPVRNSTPTQAQVTAFCEAARRCQHDMRQLTGLCGWK